MEWVSGEAKKYQIFELLGEGRSAKVYRAYRYSYKGQYQEEVAIKILKKGNSVQELIQEFQILKPLESNRVVKVYGVERLFGKVAVIMEYVSGISLACLLKKNISENLKKYIYSEIKKALFELQKQQTFHGDLAPQNIMVTKNAKVKLLDFSNHYAALYKKHGTKNYMPEEHINGKHRGILTDFSALNLMFPNSQKWICLEYNLSAVKKELSQLESQWSAIHIKTELITKRSAFAASFTLFFLIGLLFVFSPKNNSLMAASNGETYQVTITSKKWAYIKISEQLKGYTPFHFQTSNKNVKIQWYNKTTSGKLKLGLSEDKSYLSLDSLINKKE